MKFVGSDMYGKGWSSSVIHNEEELKMHLDIPQNNNKRNIIKKHKLKKRIKITDQWNQYAGKDWNSSWFNAGIEEDDAESYGIKLVEDVNQILVNGNINDEDTYEGSYLGKYLIYILVKIMK